MFGLRGGLLRGSGLTDRRLGLGLLYGHRLWEDLLGEALEEPCSGTFPHLGEERGRVRTWRPSVSVLPPRVPVLNSASFPWHSDTITSTLFLPAAGCHNFYLIYTIPLDAQ